MKLLLCLVLITALLSAGQIDIESLKGERALFERQFFQLKKQDFTSYFLSIERIRLCAMMRVGSKDLPDSEQVELLEQIETLENYQGHLVDLLFGSSNREFLSGLVESINNRNIDPEKLEALLFLRLLESVLEKSAQLHRDIPGLDKLALLFNKIRDNENKGIYNELLRNHEFSRADLIAVGSAGRGVARIIAFDQATGRLFSGIVYQGSTFAGMEVLALGDDFIELFCSADGQSIVLQFDGQIEERVAAGKSVKAGNRIVPYFDWYDPSTVFEARKGSKFNLYLKVVNASNQPVAGAEVTCAGKTFTAKNNGMIHMVFPAASLKPGSNTISVSGPAGETATFQVKVKPIDCIFFYNASVTGNAGIGGDILLASVTGSVHPGYSVGITFMTPDIGDTGKDTVFYTTNPSFGGSLAATLGPQLKPFSINAFDHNIGAGAGATVSGSIKVTAGFNQSYHFSKPYSDDRKAQCVLFADKMLDFTPVAKPIMSSLFAKMSGVKIADYMIGANVTLVGEVGISGNIGASLGLVNPTGDGIDAGISADVISGSVNLGAGIEGGFINGMTVFGPTDDRYQVVLKSNISGNFSALKLSGKIFQTKIIPDYFLADNSGSLDMAFIFRYDGSKRFTNSILVLKCGYLIRNNVYHDFVRKLIQEVKDSGGSTSDYSELTGIIGVDKFFILVLDRDKTERFFGEWLAFSRNLLNENNMQNGNSVVAKVKGMFGAVQSSINRMADYPILYIKKTELKLGSFKPGFNVELSAGIKINLGVNTSFNKSKAFHDEFGYLARFNCYPLEQCTYNRDMARSKREVSYLMDQIRQYIVDEVSDAASYVYQKAADGTIYIVQKVSDGAVYVIEVAADGAVKIAKKTGAAAQQVWNNVMNAVGNAAEYVYDTGSSVINTVGDTLSNIWDTIWGW
ncbi:MAG: hypothetical protein PHQ23_12270 [Candidatus Wallbacteria bacterium]|nr:hypothetical protein [Candidatus Wallbacteria bacterium]